MSVVLVGYVIGIDLLFELIVTVMGLAIKWLLQFFCSSHFWYSFYNYATYR